MNPEDFGPPRTIPYKAVGDVVMNLHVFEPPVRMVGERRSAIVFFFGGGWDGGCLEQFYPHCAYLASRGLFACAADYRVRSRHDVSPFECVADGKSAVRYLRAHADELGIDPRRIAAGGGSAGGHVAACTGVVDGLDEPHEDAAVSSRADLLVLFNPALVLADVEGKWKLRGRFLETVQRRMGDRDPRQISPAHHVTPGDPPAIVFHGEDDESVPYVTAELFELAMTDAGNRCLVVGFGGKGHGFFNFDRDREAFRTTMDFADAFLKRYGFVEGEDTIDAFLADCGPVRGT